METDLPNAHDARGWSPARRVAAALGLVLVVGVLFATQHYAAAVSAGRPADWWSVVGRSFTLWLLWAALAPAVLWVDRRIPLESNGKLLWRLAWHLPLGLAFSAFHTVLYTLVVHGVREGALPSGTELHASVMRSLAAGFLIYLVIVAGGRAVRYYRAFRQRETERLQLEARLLEARLETLRGQLQPHFLFNTLHAISALMEDDVKAARRTMSRLSTILRSSLDLEGSHEIALSRELELLSAYVDIQRTRFGDRLQVEWSVEPGTEGVLVPHLLLQPLVENAIRHGIEPRPGPGRVEVEAVRREGALRLVVRDDGAGLGGGPGAPGADGGDGAPREGVGLGNTRARLRQLYGERQSLRIRERPGGGTEVIVQLPAREAEDG